MEFSLWTLGPCSTHVTQSAPAEISLVWQLVRLWHKPSTMSTQLQQQLTLSAAADAVVFHCSLHNQWVGTVTVWWLIHVIRSWPLYPLLKQQTTDSLDSRLSLTVKCKIWVTVTSELLSACYTAMSEVAVERTYLPESTLPYGETIFACRTDK